MDWIDLVQNRNRWWALVNAVMKLRVGNFLTNCESVRFLRKTAPRSYFIHTAKKSYVIHIHI